MVHEMKDMKYEMAVNCKSQSKPETNNLSVPWFMVFIILKMLIILIVNILLQVEVSTVN